ncbi:uncharacterized protein LOC108678326 [Hyalella azteca]|uniref:Uncharacterized protein LOC108678326 n=1 Tax=Hyalella azteca TaxID=294128 RepID=A0A8B7PAH7_HYAAZ|nr:uncharacterized protein LOC108678326 [Hyalella azteca]
MWVCRRWRTVFKNNFSWSLTCKKSMRRQRARFMCKMLSEMNRLVTLAIPGQPHLHMILQTIAENCIYLKNLDISSKKLRNEFAMVALCERCDSLNYLDMNNTSMSSKTGRAILSTLLRMPKDTLVNINFCKWVNHETLTILSNHINGRVAVRYFPHVWHQNLVMKDYMNKLFGFIAITVTRRNCAFMEKMTELGHCRSLIIALIDHFDESTQTRFFSRLLRNAQIQCIWFKHSNLNLTSLCEAFSVPVCSSLSFLRLDLEGWLDDKVYKTIVSAIPCVKYLYLAKFTRIREDVFDDIYQCKKLEMLTLNFVILTVNAFINIRTNLPRLRVLTLYNATNILPEDIAVLQRVMPDVQLLYTPSLLGALFSFIER